MHEDCGIGGKMKETELTGQQEYEALKEYTDHTGESINGFIRRIIKENIKKI